MRWLTAAVAVALTVTLVWFAAGPSGEQPRGSAVAAAQDDGAEQRSSEGRKAPAGHGPPLWAEGRGGADGPGDKHAWREVWKGLTATQREETMSRLAQQHTSGMRAWKECVSDGRDDCEKPLPPGLAKKQLRP